MTYSNNDSRRPRRRLSLRILAATFLVAAIAVGVTSSASAQHRDLTKVSLRLDFLIRGHHSGFYVALDKGWYKDAGLDVSIAEGTGSAPTAQSVAAGNDTFGFVDATSMIAANAQGAGLQMIANMRAKNGAAIIVRKTSGITSPTGLAGHKLAITPPGTFFYNIWPLYAKAAGIDTSQVTLVPMSNFIFVSQFLAGNVDGIIGLVDGELTQIQLANVPVNVFPFADKGLDTISHGIVAKKSYIDANPKVVQAFITATLKGWKFMLDNPNQAIGILQKTFPNISAVQYVDRIKGVKNVITTKNNAGHPLGWMSPKDWGATAALLYKYGGDVYKTIPGGLDNLYTNKFIPPCVHKAAKANTYCT